MPKKNSNSKLPHPNPVPVTNQALTHTPHTGQHLITSDSDREESRRGASRRQIGATRTHGALTSLSESTLHVRYGSSHDDDGDATHYGSVVAVSRHRQSDPVEGVTSQQEQPRQRREQQVQFRDIDEDTAATTHWTSMKKISTSL